MSVDPRPLAIVCLVAGLVTYLGAVAGVFVAHATPPSDVGALATLVTFLVMGALAWLLRQGKPAA